MCTRHSTVLACLAGGVCLAACVGNSNKPHNLPTDPYLGGDANAGGDALAGDTAPSDLDTGDGGDPVPADEDRGRPGPHELTPASGTVSGGQYRVEFQLGHPLRQTTVAGGETTVEGAAAVKP